MEIKEGVPVPVNGTPSQEVEIEDSTSLFPRLSNQNNNTFLSRGCCQAPRVYHKNEMVFQHRCSKFDSHDWLKSIPVPESAKVIDIAEVR
ncbi:MAG TPA: hypothetical protein PKN44_12925, partial [Bacteroidales bacterium]|nr:hypothetical protein [Bacteroidales bacterium]